MKSIGTAIASIVGIKFLFRDNRSSYLKISLIYSEISLNNSRLDLWPVCKVAAVTTTVTDLMRVVLDRIGCAVQIVRTKGSLFIWRAVLV